MDYIKLLMDDNHIYINTYFGISGSAKYNMHDKIFYFDSKYNLRSKDSKIRHSSIFVKLLAGKYLIII